MFKNQIPAPPTGMVMSPYYNLILAANLVIVAAVLLWTIRDAFRTRRAIPVLIMAGAAVASLQECLYDVVTLVWWAQYGTTPLYRIFNISVPVWMLAAYPWYIGGMGYFAYRQFKGGMTRSGLWKLYFFGWFANLLLEVPALQLGDIYTYYGDQPFEILRFPLWMAMTNSLMPILAGGLVYVLDDVLTGTRSLMVIALVPMATAAAEIASGWPVWLALNSGAGPVATHLAALVTLGLSLMIAYLVGLKLCPANARSVQKAGRPGLSPGAAST